MFNLYKKEPATSAFEMPNLGAGCYFFYFFAKLEDRKANEHSACRTIWKNRCPNSGLLESIGIHWPDIFENSGATPVVKGFSVEAIEKLEPLTLGIVDQKFASIS